ncbi:hypothetical protein Sjap_017205 [Stephania japonica]|uniref:RRM domain-containing protein n=1 Tax=Stephania japonica TaxID=461633 RepID=A0AAP0I5R1_9MAGN
MMQSTNNAADPQQQQQHQQWMMQYPAATMMMHQHHQMMPPPPPHYPQAYMGYASQQPLQQQQQVSAEDNKTVWVGDLQYWMDENYLNGCFAQTGEVRRMYFLHKKANLVIDLLCGIASLAILDLIPDCWKVVRHLSECRKLTGILVGDRKMDGGGAHQMVRRGMVVKLVETRQIKSIKVIRNKQTGQSECYGFVEFFSHAAAEKVLQSLNGSAMPTTDQPFRLNWASFSTGERRSDSGSDHSIFVGDLAPDVTDVMLQETFSNRYSSVKGAKVVMDANTGRSKSYGFVRFGDDNERSRAITEMNGVYCSTRPMRVGVATPRKSSGYQQQYSSQGGYASNGVSVHSDEDPNNTTALQRLNGTVIGKQTVRLSWGRNPGNKQSRVDAGNQWNGAYYGGQVYDGYGGYAMQPQQDLSMYAAAGAYGAYPVYGNNGNNQPQVS